MNVRRFARIAAVFVVTRAFIYAFGTLMFSMLKPGKFFDRAATEGLGFLDLWDSRWYTRIASEGYTIVANRQSSVAFFPLYPALIRGLTELGLEPRTAGILISNVALFAAACLLDKLVRVDTEDDELATRSVILLLVSPVSFFHSAVYTEGLFILLATTGLVAARKERWLLAAVAGFFLGLTRSTGALLTAAIGLELLDSGRLDLGVFRRVFASLRKPRVAWLAALGPIAGTLTYFAYLGVTLGEPWAALREQQHWGRRLAPPWVAIREMVAHEDFYVAFASFGLATLAVAALLALWQRERVSYVVYLLGSLAYCTCFATGDSMVRLTSVAVPMYFVYARATRNSTTAYSLVLAAFAMCFSVSIILFANGYWVV